MNCSRCKVYKSLSKFYICRSSKSGYRSECKDCTKFYKLLSINSQGLDGHIKKLYYDINNRCKKTNGRINNYLTIDDIYTKYNEQNGKCSLTGIELTYIRGKGKVHTNMSIDRIDSTIDYNYDNIQIVCSIINTMKWDLKQSDFINYCNLVIINSIKK